MWKWSSFNSCWSLKAGVKVTRNKNLYVKKFIFIEIIQSILCKKTTKSVVFHTKAIKNVQQI